MIAQLGVTDMRLPIQYAFSYPERWAAPLPSLDLARAGRLEFEPPDTDRFPCLGLAYRALRGPKGLLDRAECGERSRGGGVLDGRLGFTGIPEIIGRAMDADERNGAASRLAASMTCGRIDRWAREFAARRGCGVQIDVLDYR